MILSSMWGRICHRTGYDPLFFVFKAENQQEEVLRVIPRNLNSYVGVVNQPPLQWGGAGKRLLHTNFAPGYAPEPEQKPVCRQFSRCEDCPYPSHGFLCWSSEDDCMRTRMKKLNGKGTRHLLNSGENITMKQIQIWLGHSTYVHSRCQRSCRASDIKKAGSVKSLPALAETVGFEPTCGCPQTDFESLEAGVFWSILSASLRPSERRKPLILLEFPAFLLSAQGFGNFFRQSRFSGKV